MISIDPNSLSDQENYRLLIGSIIPRPIAFVTTLSKGGVLNGAPFSYFSIVSSQPPLISVSIQRKQGVMKDTSRNAVDIGAFVVHIVDESIVEAINVTAASLPPDESEITLANLKPIDSEKILVPGIQEAKIRMECVLERAIPLGGTESQPSCDLIIGRVVRFHVADDAYENGYISAEKLKPVSRLAGNYYATIGAQFEMERPQ